ncbi:MAG: hypothetical protein Q8N48_02575 [Thiobacillus sp.]|nr:hypothetical protein [Thiobacillus sp.]MDP2977694.1 hypothetical protein [Thiobacillus sp.]
MNEAADYLKAAKALSKAEDALNGALDRLEAAREAADPERVTPARIRAQAATRDAEAASEIAFQAHKSYWRAQAQAAERRLIEAVSPHIAEVNDLHRLAGSLLTNPARGLIEHIIAGPCPAFVPKAMDVPLEFPDSSALERAETEIIARQPGWKMPARKT